MKGFYVCGRGSWSTLEDPAGAASLPSSAESEFLASAEPSVKQPPSPPAGRCKRAYI